MTVTIILLGLIIGLLLIGILVFVIEAVRYVFSGEFELDERLRKVTHY